ncbi:hypothetical protein DL89DRAFT_5002 [Linderina pennispora]|uniref:Uncharacterized protein n=1 Tax=Linderina pennispora TaxID=61395 RepID=A0A1Y1WKF0_9FUNG|nr:uncharacterized protein DL89DRAFT_5002 [Linderina pennispora]ORX73855.1 hypothetical protein DL89DRAFT_5002 [Linderina pennispora]
MAAELEKLPVATWLNPSSECRVVVGGNDGVRLYRMNAYSDKAGSKVQFDLEAHRVLHQRTTALAAYGRELDMSGVVAVGSAAGEVDLHFFPLHGDHSTLNSHMHAAVVGVYPSSGRVCQALAFNPGRSDILACGFDHMDGRRKPAHLRHYADRRGAADAGLAVGAVVKLQRQCGVSV